MVLKVDLNNFLFDIIFEEVYSVKKIIMIKVDIIFSIDEECWNCLLKKLGIVIVLFVVFVYVLRWGVKRR